jgi:hypothetical protein
MDGNGHGMEIDIAQLDQTSKPSFMGFQKRDMLFASIMSGCDYLESLKGMGFKRAQKVVSKHLGSDIFQILDFLDQE